METDLEVGSWLQPWKVHQGDSAELIHKIKPETVALSIWSPPYHVGKDYEAGQTFPEWQRMIREVIEGHYRVLKPGGFCVINIADILCFPDESMPKIQAETLSQRRITLTREQILEAIANLGTTKRQDLADHFGVSEQTIDRRLNGNNIRGGKYHTQTRIKTVAGMIEEMALDAGLYLYDRRIWLKDPAWANSQWASSSFRAVDEFEYVFFLWKPGITVVNRQRLDKEEWGVWGSRAVWNIPSVRANDNHEAKFPMELPNRIIRLLSDEGDLVLDPFSGSGTTHVATIQLGRIPIGIELMPQYCELANRSLNEALNSRESKLFI
jgi:site-specific DNA-methyltransferase (adenine-specific)